MDWVTRSEASSQLNVTHSSIWYYLTTGKMEWKVDGPRILVKAKVYPTDTFPRFQASVTTFACINCKKGMTRKSNGMVPRFCSPECRVDYNKVTVITPKSQPSESNMYIAHSPSFSSRAILTHNKEGYKHKALSTLARWSSKAEDLLRSKA